MKLKNLFKRRPEPVPDWVVKFYEALATLLERHMARVEDKINELNTTLGEIGFGVAGVQGDVSNLSNEIAALKEQVANAGALTPEQETAFDAAIQKAKDAAAALAALDAMNPATDAGGGVATPQPDA